MADSCAPPLARASIILLCAVATSRIAACRSFCMAARCASVVGLVSSVVINPCTVAKMSREPAGPRVKLSPLAGCPSIRICTPAKAMLSPLA